LFPIGCLQVALTLPDPDRIIADLSTPLPAAGRTGRAAC